MVHEKDECPGGYFFRLTLNKFLQKYFDELSCLKHPCLTSKVNRKFMHRSHLLEVPWGHFQILAYYT